jgi:hypothetical protein
MVMVRVHEPELAAAIIEQAVTIADDHERDPAQWLAIFHEACQLLGARVPFIPPPPTPVNFGGLRLDGRPN